MERQPVKSNSIRSIGYDAAAETLEVEFQDGGLFRYFAVPEFLYRGLMLAESKGGFFNTRLHGRFKFEQVR
jgi:hypothetical protein